MTEVLVTPSELEPVDSAMSELFENETMFNREQIIDYCFTETDKKSGRKIVDVLMPLNGTGDYAKLAPTSPFIMPQIRDLYDANHVLGLGKNICKTGQLQNCGVALVSREHIERYVEDLNTFFETAIDVDDIPYHEKFGGYLITIFGHNRQLGVGAVNRNKNGDPDRGTPILAKVFRDPPFWSVLEMQAVENTGLLPNMWDRSRAIVQYKALRTRDGMPPSQQEIAEKFGVDKDQVWRAERYEKLPGDVKKLVVADKLVYSGAIELDRLFGLYDEEDVIHLAQRLSERTASTEQIVDEVNKRIAVTGLTPEIFVMVEEGAITLPQAKELNRLKAVGVDLGSINGIADWICLKRPDIREIRKEVNSLIHLQLSGGRSLFTDGDDLDPGERERLIAQMGQEQITDLLRGNITDISRSLRGMMAELKSGRVSADVAQKGVIKDNVRHELADLLEQIAEGNVAGINPQDIETLEEILDLETNLAEDDMFGVRALQAARRVLAKVHESEPAQVGLF